MVETNVMESAYAQRQSLLGAPPMTGLTQKLPLGGTSVPIGGTGASTLAPPPTTATSLTGESLGQAWSQPFQQTQQTTVIGTQQQFAATNIIQEKPVLDRVEKLLHKEVIQKPHIQEQLKQDIIEIHEKPIEKRFMHPVQEVRVQDQGTFEVQGREIAEMERERIFLQMREQDRLHRVEVDQRQDVTLINEAPIASQSREMRMEIIEKPIVTEIHEQPIREIHEQSLLRTIYQPPLISFVREQKVYESVGSQVPLVYDPRAFATVQPMIAAQPQTQFQQPFGVVPQQQQPITQYGYTGAQAPLTYGAGSPFVGGMSQPGLPLQQQQPLLQQPVQTGLPLSTQPQAQSFAYGTPSMVPSTTMQQGYLPTQQPLIQQQQAPLLSGSQQGYGAAGWGQSSSNLPTGYQSSFATQNQPLQQQAPMMATSQPQSAWNQPTQQGFVQQGLNTLGSALNQQQGLSSSGLTTGYSTQQAPISSSFGSMKSTMLQ